LKDSFEGFELKYNINGKKSGKKYHEILLKRVFGEN